MATINYPVSVSQLEKKFGPYIPGKGEPSHTISAIKQVTTGKARGSYLGVPGIVPDAVFHIQFPAAVNLSEFKVSAQGAKHFADGVKDLASDGLQGGQGRRAAFEAWRLVASWESELQKLSGSFEAEVRIPALKRSFAATVAISGAPGRKKASIKGALRPIP